MKSPRLRLLDENSNYLRACRIAHSCSTRRTTIDVQFKQMGNTLQMGGTRLFALANYRCAKFRLTAPSYYYMSYLSMLLELLASISGLIAVYYWWKSARMGPIDVPAGSMPPGGPGDMYAEYDDKHAIYINNSLQSRRNATAAGWTGISILLQTLAIIIQVVMTR